MLDHLTDLRFVAAVAQAGSLAGAARKLGVNHATAFRRITAVEARLGVRLFERSAGHYVATPAGDELARAGAAIEQEATQSLLKVAGRDLRPSGVVRVTTTDSIQAAFITKMPASVVPNIRRSSGMSRPPTRSTTCLGAMPTSPSARPTNRPST